MIIDLLFQGATLGALYGLIGAGLALNFGILKVVNLAHGEFITLGAFMAVGLVAAQSALPLPLILTGAFLGCALIGVVLQAAFVERAMTFRDPMVPMLVTFGLAVMIRNGLLEALGADQRGLDVGGLAQARITLVGQSFGLLPLITLGLALAAFAGLATLIFRTRFGREVRAVSDRPEIAAILGVRVKRIHLLVAGLSAGLAALAGVLLAMRASVSPFSGVSHLLIAFEVVVLGGIGRIRGVLIAGLILGLAQVVAQRFDANAGLLYVHLVFFTALVGRAVTGRLA
ncbi:branched-chain amino acid ABC transporter permease [Pararhodobacter zhoushanensis]|uniref:Branched-chain amino acid ABC transporter permease n=1 Tax=Pararhodobacter zhoushanensis TaxID=2479545 RepID=A0ABT3H532_9RHOB|nr:branched-chain amino acid ABC transporter permease [Pararhodobacter zhoushanensis]MCW1934906.1 branched-chain amino acid ABC transporter permease [Pararhodobacter zhoushanensis]